MGKVQIKTYSNKAAPLKAHEQTVMVKFTAPETQSKHTAPLDIVLVLDTSGSMAGHKLAKLKKAMEMVIHKLGAGDRLAVVPFASEPDKTRARLLNASSTVKKESHAFVHHLKAHGNTNIRAGLQVGVDILLARGAAREGRTGVVFLMSDGAQNHGDAKKVDVSKVNVQTFGFGEQHDSKLLNAVAHQSHGGVFHPVTEKEDANHLAEAFAYVLGGFRSISVLNLRVTIRQPEPTIHIHDVDPGTYPAKSVGGASYSIFDLGDLSRLERRRIILRLRLPAVHKEEKPKVVLTVECSYRIVGDRKDTVGDKHHVMMERTTNARLGIMKSQVLVEVLRRDHAASIDEARKMAEKKDFHGACDKLADRLNVLAVADHPGSEEVLDFLTMEMEDLLDKMGSQHHYDKAGRALALAALSSHARQRPTARGHILDNSLFATRRMDKYLAQARAQA